MAVARYRKGPSTCFDNNLSVRADAAIKRGLVIWLWESCDAAFTRLFPLQENTSDCGRGHSFRPSLHALLLLQLLLLYPALSPLLHSILK